MKLHLPHSQLEGVGAPRGFFSSHLANQHNSRPMRDD